MSIHDLAPLRFAVPGAAGVHSDASGTARWLVIPEVEGILALEPDALVMQYRVRDRAAAYDSGVQELRVPLSSVETVEVQRRWFGAPRLIIRVRDLAVLAAVPGARGGELAIEVRRDDLATANDIASSIALNAAERQLAGGDKHAALHPPDAA